MSTITGDELVATVRQLAQDNPERIANCKYVNKYLDDETNSYVSETVCIIGQAVAKLELDTPEVMEYLLERNHKTVIQLVSNDREKFTDFSGSQIRWLNQVQYAQDERNKWEVAVEIADEDYPLGIE